MGFKGHGQWDSAGRGSSSLEWNRFADLVGISTTRDWIWVIVGWITIGKGMVWRKWSDMGRLRQKTLTLKKGRDGFRCSLKRTDVSLATSLLWMKQVFFLHTCLFLFFLAPCPAPRITADGGLSDHNRSGVKRKKVRLTHEFTLNAGLRNSCH